MTSVAPAKARWLVPLLFQSWSDAFSLGPTPFRVLSLPSIHSTSKRLDTVNTLPVRSEVSTETENSNNSVLPSKIESPFGAHQRKKPAVQHGRHATTKECLEWFDSLRPVDKNFMMGSWRGSGVITGHPMDGMLEAARWHGKHFLDEENVHPLICTNMRGETFTVNPGRLPFGLLQKLPRNSLITRLFVAFRWLVSTKKSAARLIVTEYRGVSSATMIYDDKPIADVFRKIDDDTVLGLMDMKGVSMPFFFKLEREKRQSLHGRV